MRNPRSVGAILPSGRVLARMMVSGLGPGSRVVELGAGTGTLTQAVLDAGVDPRDLLVVEQNEDFVRILKRRFPGVNVVEGDAVSLAAHAGRWPGKIDCIVSGLPLLLFSETQTRRLLTQAFSVLGDEGAFHQFTYGGRCPVSRALRRELGLRSSLIGVAPFNIPPAFVYRLRRRE